MTENAALADAIHLLAENLNQNRRDQLDPQDEMFKKLAQVMPPVFRGGANPTFLENWIREFDKLFVALNCPEGMKVDQAAMYLKDKADIWWRDNVVTGRAKPNFGWFAPEVVPTEELKAQRFEHGLTDELQKDLAGKVFKTLDKVYEIVAHLYHLNTRSASASAKAGEKRKDFGKSENQGNFKRPRNGNSFDRGNQNVSSSSNANNGERTYHCKRCRRNHPRRDCDGNLVTCRFCNKRGHREYVCYTKQKQQGNGGNGGNTQQRPNNFNN
ncbi:uncharacterized protein LOC110715185 [Chenopodium quinoa]|uniref:uncharacterized protein LOC110715185 n=1 Tax=Chenopodium quinoa TaxID=63459 RepID=UPI000B7709AC|nr:uncharacterized protein LOC110715185 [Chenopodium quinoa]